MKNKIDRIKAHFADWDGLSFTPVLFTLVAEYKGEVYHLDLSWSYDELVEEIVSFVRDVNMEKVK